mmetsp:Transcript_76650/g.159475  ORF Transcript_76650/g.159475 Transcript_76650/m.159475 type:complete len:81 (-) Transcript_76650:18-260(-)
MYTTSQCSASFNFHRIHNLFISIRCNNTSVTSNPFLHRVIFHICMHAENSLTVTLFSLPDLFLLITTIIKLRTCFPKRLH